MYTIKKGFENTNIGAKIFDGRKIFKGLLKSATQEELGELHFLGVPHIEKSDSKPIKKTRDNDPTANAVTKPPKRKRKKANVQKKPKKDTNENLEQDK